MKRFEILLLITLSHASNYYLEIYQIDLERLVDYINVFYLSLRTGRLNEYKPRLARRLPKTQCFVNIVCLAVSRNAAKKINH